MNSTDVIVVTSAQGVSNICWPKFFFYSILNWKCLLHIKGLINSKLIITVKKGVKDFLCYKTSNRYMKFISTIIRIIFFQGFIIDKGLHICYHIGHITIFLLVDSRGVGMSSKIGCKLKYLVLSFKSFWLLRKVDYSVFIPQELSEFTFICVIDSHLEDFLNEISS